MAENYANQINASFLHALLGGNDQHKCCDNDEQKEDQVGAFAIWLEQTMNDNII